MSTLKILKPKLKVGCVIKLANGEVFAVKPGTCLNGSCCFLHKVKGFNVCKAINFNFASVLESKDKTEHVYINCTQLIGAQAHFEKITSGV